MATVFLSPICNGAQFFTSGGLPLDGGLINTYAAGSTTPTATYTTSAGNVQNSNPIELGADGRPPNEIWLVSGTSYKFTLTDSLGNVLATYDNLTGINDIASSLSLSGTLAVTGATTLTGAVTLAGGGGDIKWGKALVSLGGGSAPTLGTIGGAGPSTVGQNSWMRVLDSNGVAFWVPAWK